MKTAFLHIALIFYTFNSFGQNILPTPMYIKTSHSKFIFQDEITISYDDGSIETAKYLEQRLKRYIRIKFMKSNQGDIVLSSVTTMQLGNEGYNLKIDNDQIKITANSETGLFYGIQSLFQLLPIEVQSEKPFDLTTIVLDGINISDEPKYPWRSFLLDSGRQYQTPQFIKRYIDYMAMLKMNVFHWHLTEGQGWRIEIKKYPKLTEIGSKVATGKEQQGYYNQEEIRDIVEYAKKRHISVVPEIDVPGHSEAALIAYPEMSCFNENPESVMSFSPNLFCGGKETTYQFLQDVLDEVCELFPSEYIHLGGDEAPKENWDKCPNCKLKIKEEGLKDSHDLQLYFSSRLASYLKIKNKKAIFWGDLVYHDGTMLPDNVVIQWWNSKRYQDRALKNAIKGGYPVICSTNYYTYLNLPVTPWSRYLDNRTFDMKNAYEQNPSDLSNPHKFVLGMGSALWTDYHVQENMIDRRVFPRLFALAEQMWSKGDRLPFEEFYKNVKAKYPLMRELGIDYGPAIKEEVPELYKWD